MNPKITPEYLIRAYIWAVLKANTDMTESDYNGGVPIIPIQDEPDYAESNKPYIVYGYAYEPTPSGEHYRGRGSMSLLIVSRDYNELVHLTTILHTALSREDDAATDINRFTSNIPRYIGIRFGTVDVGFMEGPTLEEEIENGRQSSMLNIRYEYFVDYDVVTSV